MSKPRRVSLEICIASVDDALAAAQGGAQRLELNCALELGGLTPSLGVLRAIKQLVALPVIAMLRPRAGGFCYSANDFSAMLVDAEMLLANGADGLAFGFLHANGEIDFERCRQVRKLIGQKQAVFHRAFDVVPAPFATLETLCELGFHRVMSSGQETSAYNGSTLLAELHERAAGRIEILPAGGINRFNVADILSRTGCNQVHASLRSLCLDSSVSAKPHLHFGKTSSTETLYEATDAEKDKQHKDASHDVREHERLCPDDLAGPASINADVADFAQRPGIVRHGPIPPHEPGPEHRRGAIQDLDHRHLDGQPERCRHAQAQDQPHVRQYPAAAPR